MPNVVFDASSLIGALLKENSLPERALLLARVHDTICLSPEVEAEIRDAIRFHIDGLKEDGLPVPSPSSIAEYVEA